MPRDIQIMQHTDHVGYLPFSWDVHQNAVWTCYRLQEGISNRILDMKKQRYNCFSLEPWKDTKFQTLDNNTLWTLGCLLEHETRCIWGIIRSFCIFSSRTFFIYFSDITNVFSLNTVSMLLNPLCPLIYNLFKDISGTIRGPNRWKSEATSGWFRSLQLGAWRVSLYGQWYEGIHCCVTNNNLLQSLCFVQTAGHSSFPTTSKHCALVTVIPHLCCTHRFVL